MRYHRIMAMVTISKVTYQRLKRHAEAYRRFAADVFEAVVRDPVGEIAHDFRKTGLYTEEFLRDLDAGLRKSSFIKKHGNRAPAARSQRISRRTES